MTIQQTLKVSVEKLRHCNIPSADLDAEVLLLEALNRAGAYSSGFNKYCYNQSKNAYRLKPAYRAGRPELRRDKSWLYMNNSYKLNKSEEKVFNSFIKQRLKHKPVAYIINKKEFYGYEFYVDENVLIPRPETEFMIEEVLRIIDDGRIDGKNKFTLIDIGTGSGCVIVSVLNEIKKNKTSKGSKVYKTNICGAYANDISAEAIKIAKLNAKKYNLGNKIKFSAGDFEKFIKENIFSINNQFIVTANLPYVKKDEYKNLLPNVRKYEPKIALIGGEDGLELIEKLINSISNIKIKNNSENNNLNVSERRRRVDASSSEVCAKSNLFNYILLETDPAQMKKIKSILKKKLNAVDIKIIKDLRGKNRLISAKIQLISSN